jgi:hypothetical protein
MNNTNCGSSHIEYLDVQTEQYAKNKCDANPLCMGLNKGRFGDWYLENDTTRSRTLNGDTCYVKQ